MNMIFGPLNLHNADLGHVAGTAEQHLKDGLPQIAFSGRSNVGKSSLINSLLGRKKLARISGEPGKTITVNYYDVDKQLWLVDLPGYGFARRPKEDQLRWKAVTQSFFEKNSVLKLVLQLVDCKVGITPDDADMLAWLQYYHIPCFLVCTKCDKLTKAQLNASAQAIIHHPAVPAGTGAVLYSAVKDLGRDALWEQILRTALVN